MQHLGKRAWCVTLASALLGALFWNATALAQSCLYSAESCINIHIDGITGEDGSGNYNVVTYDWGEPGVVAPLGASSEVTFSREIRDTTTTDVMRAAATHQKAATADLVVIYQGTVTVAYHMVNVHFVSVMHHGDSSLTNFQASPLESVSLRFKTLDYTYQPILPNGQKNGPPVTYTWKF
jgi:type VI protein secretion system component Hcp